MGLTAVLSSGAAVAAAFHGGDARVLWFEGRAVSWSGERGIVLRSGGELLAFAGDVPHLLLLRAGARDLQEAVAGPDDRIWLVDASGAVLERLPEGGVVERGRTPFDIPTLAATPEGGLWAARSARQFSFRPESSGAAVAARLDAALHVVAQAGLAAAPGNPFLAQLANAGHVLAMPDGGVVFAPFIRDEVVRYGANGFELWRTQRGLAHATPDPTLRVARDSAGHPDVQVDYAPVNLGLALGPDGRVYVLSTPEATTSRSRLYSLDARTGHVAGSHDFPTALPTIVVNARGDVTTGNADQLFPSANAATRIELEPFDLEASDGAGRVRMSDFAGRPILVNFWASWCGPCREEMPALDSLVRSYGGQLAFAALSDDVRVEDARRFLRTRNFQFPAGLGRGDLKGRYHFFGLPHTILADARGRVIYQWTGYGGESQLQAIAALVDAELALAGDSARHRMVHTHH